MLDKLINRYKDVYVAAAMKLETELRTRLSEKDHIIQTLETRLAQYEAKITRMELTLMPLSSRAGAAYVNSTQERGPLVQKGSTDQSSGARQLIPMESTSWQSYLRAYLKKEEETDKLPSDTISTGQ